MAKHMLFSRAIHRYDYGLLCCFPLAQPQNILLTSESPLGDIKVGGFWPVEAGEQRSGDQGVMGTPEYVGKEPVQIRFRGHMKSVLDFSKFIFFFHLNFSGFRFILFSFVSMVLFFWTSFF